MQESLDDVLRAGAQLEFVVEESALKATTLAAAPIVLEVRGEQLDRLETLADTVAHELRAIPGLYGVRTSLVPSSPETKVRVIKDRAATYHLSVSDIALTAQTAIKGFVATKFKEQGREIDVRVRLRPQDRADLSRVRRLTIRSPLQQTVPLADVAYLAVGTGPTEIQRLDRQRVVLVSGNLLQRTVGEALRDIEAALRRVAVPAGCEVKVTGENQQMQESFRSLQFALGLSLLLVYMIMASTFESLWQPFLIMATIPMSAIGIVAALWVTGTPLSAMVGLGLIILGGIVVDNGIVLIDYVNLLQSQGRSAYDAVLEASRTRLRPILMTTATTVLGLLPLALGIGEGVELQGPMAITVMGGLLSSTFLTLVVLPTFYLIGAEVVAWWFPARLTAPVPLPTPEPPPAPPEPLPSPPAVPPETAAPSALPPLLTGPATPEALLLPPPPPLPPLTFPISLNARQRWLLETLKTEGRMARKDYAVRTGASIPTAARDLKELVDAGLIRGTGPLGPGRMYERATPPTPP